MMPLAPGRLSTTTGRPVFLVIHSPSMRAEMSPEPPGPNGTMICMGLSSDAALATAGRLQAATA